MLYPVKKLSHLKSGMLVIALLLQSITGMAQTKDEPITPFPGGQDADLWVLAGQSNMLGCALLKGPTEPDPRIMEFGRDKRWVVAEEPLHQDCSSYLTLPASTFPFHDNFFAQRYGV